MIAAIRLSGRATGASDGGVPGACPLVVAHSREYQAQAAEELALLPEQSVIAKLLAEYAVMREQAPVCGVWGRELI